MNYLHRSIKMSGGKLTGEQVEIGREIENYIDRDVISYNDLGASSPFMCVMECGQHASGFGNIIVWVNGNATHPNVLEIPIDKAAEMYRNGTLKEHIQTELAIYLIKQGA